jgi:hypothetical protein
MISEQDLVLPVKDRQPARLDRSLAGGETRNALLAREGMQSGMFLRHSIGLGDPRIPH